MMEIYDDYLHKRFIETQLNIDKLVYPESKKIDFLYHYTELNGFLGIFKTKSLWASNAFFLNDSSEIEYGLELTHDLFNDFYLALENNKTKEALKGFFTDYSGFLLSSNMFLVSFCENGDLLSQWRGYTQSNEGLSLRFNVPVIRTLPNVDLHKVIYDKVAQVQIACYLFELLEDIMNSITRTTSECNLHYFNAWITRFTTTILTFKDDSFSEEREWRLIYNHDAKGNNKNINYRTKNNYILPYIEIDKLSLFNLISEITVGPSATNKILGESIKYFLEMNKYNNIGIDYSAIPFRG